MFNLLFVEGFHSWKCQFNNFHKFIMIIMIIIIIIIVLLFQVSHGTTVYTTAKKYWLPDTISLELLHNIYMYVYSNLIIFIISDGSSHHMDFQ